MTALNPTSNRPTILVDRQGRAITDPINQVILGYGTLGQERLVYALPLNGETPLPLRSTINSGGTGETEPWIARLLSAGIAPDTRRW